MDSGRDPAGMGVPRVPGGRPVTRAPRGGRSRLRREMTGAGGGARGTVRPFTSGSLVVDRLTAGNPPGPPGTGAPATPRARRCGAASRVHRVEGVDITGRSEPAS